MKTIKILHMYADMLDLYGDSGNMEIIGYRCKKRGIECTHATEVPLKTRTLQAQTTHAHGA